MSNGAAFMMKRARCWNSGVSRSPWISRMRDGDTEIHILTNLPWVRAKVIARLYQKLVD